MSINTNIIFSIGIIGILAVFTLVLVGNGLAVVPASAGEQFGIFAGKDPMVAKVDELRTHVFEAHKSAEKANTTAILEHLTMADEELSELQGNMSSSMT
jgi:hypothetical protein